MMEIELTLRTCSPLALRANRAALQFAPGLHHIPGTTLRGALAARYLQTGHPNDPNFVALFLGEQGFFADLYPVPRDNHRQPLPGVSKPLPATARACKRHGSGHLASVTDSLLRLELATLLKQSTPLRELAWEKCPECADNNRDRLAGYYLGPVGFRKVETRQRLITSTSINRATGTAEEAQLFSFDVLEEDQFFRGRLRFRPDVADELLAKLKELAPEKHILRLGMDKSRGFGKVEIIGWRERREAEIPLETRWAHFNEAARQLWQRFGSDQPDGLYFSLTLESSLIRRDRRLLQPQTDIPKPADLDLPGNIEVSRGILNTLTVQGWNAALGLPKTDTPALGPGTVLLYCLKDPTQQEALLARLKEIEQAGIGERRNEGFGRVSVCDPFHYYWTLQEVKHAQSGS